MYKFYSFLTGIILGMMILSHSILTNAIGNFAGFVLIHIIALTSSIILFLATRTKFKSLKSIPLIFLLGGFSGYFGVFIINIGFLKLGATVTLMLSMFGQILASSIIDHYGLLGMEKFPFDKKKLIGISFMLLGVGLIVFN